MNNLEILAPAPQRPRAVPATAHVASGFGELDQILPGGGWPLGELTEILHAQPGIGPLRLLMPALARLSRQGRWVALVAPPALPHGPSMAAFGVDLRRVLLVHPRRDGLRALELALREGRCGAVIGWARSAESADLARLGSAARTGGALAVLFREADAAGHPSPAALRLLLESSPAGAAARLVSGGPTVELDLDPVGRPGAPVGAAPAPRGLQRPQPRPRQLRPLRRPAPQLDLPLPKPVRPEARPLRQDKPGILTWLWRK